MSKQYEKINDEFRSELEKNLQTAIVEQCRKEALEEHFYKYEVQLQNIRFVTYMSDEELESSVKMTIALLEEMKVINNDGMEEQEFRKRVTEIEEANEDELYCQSAFFLLRAIMRMHSEEIKEDQCSH